MQRTLTTLGLILSLLMGGCGDDPHVSAMLGHDGGTRTDDFCSLPTTTCEEYDQDATAGADAGSPTGASDASVLVPQDAESTGDAGVAMDDAGNPNPLDNPCDDEDCPGDAPHPAVCGSGFTSAVVCKPSFFGACEWHFQCGTP
jgi:hypothetical protein